MHDGLGRDRRLPRRSASTSLDSAVWTERAPQLGRRSPARTCRSSWTAGTPQPRPSANGSDWGAPPSATPSSCGARASGWTAAATSSTPPATIRAVRSLAGAPGPCGRRPCDGARHQSSYLGELHHLRRTRRRRIPVNLLPGMERTRDRRYLHPRRSRLLRGLLSLARRPPGGRRLGPGCAPWPPCARMRRRGRSSPVGSGWA